jgi:hemoglobin
MDLLDTQIYGLIGEEGIARIVAAFYRRVPGDDILGKMYPIDDLAGAEERLRGFLIQRFGGLVHYSQQRGHPRLRMRHAPFRINTAGRDRWLRLMDEALAEVNPPAAAIAPLRKFFSDAATFMINHADD